MVEKKREARLAKRQRGGLVLAGGTALALQLGHRFSYDFDLFSLNPIASKMVLKAKKIFGQKIKLIVNTSDELSLITADRVKISLVHFPFLPLHRPIRKEGVFLSRLDDLATNKAYVVGRRGLFGKIVFGAAGLLY
ncbi:MAG: nucleotidyl transferase AbiEii/AbiGii toxin family protein [Candidatus Shapirobacteria bacterium]